MAKTTHIYLDWSYKIFERSARWDWHSQIWDPQLLKLMALGIPLAPGHLSQHRQARSPRGPAWVATDAQSGVERDAVEPRASEEAVGNVTFLGLPAGNQWLKMVHNG